MVRIAVLGICVKDGHIMDWARSRLSDHDLDVRCVDSVALDEDLDRLADFLKIIPEIDLMLIHVHGDVSYFRHWEEVRRRIEETGCSALLNCTEFETTAEYRYLFRQGDEDYTRILRLQEIGGDENQYATAVWALDTFGGCDLEIPEPVRPMTEGFYHPDIGTLGLDEGIERTLGTDRPVIGLFFHQKYWLVHNTGAVETLIRCIEERGAKALPIFMAAHENPLTGSMGIKRLVDDHLIRNGRPVVDCIVNTMGFSQTLLADPGSGEQVSVDNFFARLDVPVIQAISLYNTPKEWRDSPMGLNAADISMSVVNPEFDGQIDTVPYGGTEMDDTGVYRQIAIGDRCSMIADTAYRWAMLRHIPNSEKRIAILLYMYPPRQDLAGGGYGLDSLQSVSDMLRRFKDAGYSLDWLPEDGRELVARLLDGVTNDDNWKSDMQLREASIDLIDKETYLRWFEELSEAVKERWKDSWGDPPGELHTLDGKQMIPGILNGNIFIGFQPDRGKCSTEAYHDGRKAPPHQYLGVYRWLRDVFGANGVVHVGTHGTLEWLPGKGAGLSGDCDPDIVLGNIPNVNPYIIDNPGEGMQAKRRSYAVITTHMIPAMTRSGGYERMDELENAVQAFIKAREFVQNDKLPSIMDNILRICGEMDMTKDLELPENPTAEQMSECTDRLYDYILEIKDAMIKDGLHILGEIPSGERMDETVYSLVRYRNGDIPSLRETVASSFGLDMEELLKDPSGFLPDGRLKGEASDEVDGISMRIIEGIRERDFDYEKSITFVRSLIPDGGEDLDRAVGFICGFIRDALYHMPDELGSIIDALDGRYVLPGPAGCPGRGRAQILPTGRNFYSIDPDGVPWHSSWEIGSKMADQMVERYVTDNGTYPKSVGIILWATDTMKTGGDDVSYILRLMGLRPVWTGYGGRVKDTEVIPLSELGRPRIDVTIRISGLFRDTFPNLCRILDDAAVKIAGLDEDDDSNYLAANLRRDTVEAIASGIPADIARRNASIRIFGDAPGQYGCGISDAIQNGDWKTLEDLSDIYVRNGCSVYGRGLQGESRPDLFRKRLGTMDVTVKNHNTRAVDMLDMDDDMDNLGGLNAAVKAIRGREAVSYMGDSSDTDNLRLRTAQEECRFVFRSKIDNPKWTEGLKKHGFSGPKELSKLFDYTVGWSATSDIVEKWMYDDLAERFVLDEENREWIKDENPYAMMAMLARLQEAIQRGFWDADADMRERLKEVYLEFEERIEEITDR